MNDDEVLPLKDAGAAAGFADEKQFGAALTDDLIGKAAENQRIEKYRDSVPLDDLNLGDLSRQDLDRLEKETKDRGNRPFYKSWFAGAFGESGEHGQRALELIPGAGDMAKTYRFAKEKSNDVRVDYGVAGGDEQLQWAERHAGDNRYRTYSERAGEGMAYTAALLGELWLGNKAGGAIAATKYPKRIAGIMGARGNVAAYNAGRAGGMSARASVALGKRLEGAVKATNIKFGEAVGMIAGMPAASELMGQGARVLGFSSIPGGGSTMKSLERAFPEVWAELNDKQRQEFALMTEEDFVSNLMPLVFEKNALLRGYMENVVERGIEVVGGKAIGFGLGKIPIRPMTQAIQFRAMRRALDNMKASTGMVGDTMAATRQLLGKMQDRVAWNGFLTETAEELVQGAVVEETFGEDWRDGLPQEWEDMAVILTISAMPGGAAAAWSAVHVVARKRERKLIDEAKAALEGDSGDPKGQAVGALVGDVEYDDFKESGDVSDARVAAIAMKSVTGKPLSDQEQEMGTAAKARVEQEVAAINAGLKEWGEKSGMEDLQVIHPEDMTPAQAAAAQLSADLESTLIITTGKGPPFNNGWIDRQGRRWVDGNDASPERVAMHEIGHALRNQETEAEFNATLLDIEAKVPGLLERAGEAWMERVEHNIRHGNMPAEMQEQAREMLKDEQLKEDEARATVLEEYAPIIYHFASSAQGARDAAALRQAAPGVWQRMMDAAKKIGQKLMRRNPSMTLTQQRALAASRAEDRFGSIESETLELGAYLHGIVMGLKPQSPGFTSTERASPARKPSKQKGIIEPERAVARSPGFKEGAKEILQSLERSAQDPMAPNVQYNPNPVAPFAYGKKKPRLVGGEEISIVLEDYLKERTPNFNLAGKHVSTVADIAHLSATLRSPIAERWGWLLTDAKGNVVDSGIESIGTPLGVMEDDDPIFAPRGSALDQRIMQAQESTYARHRVADSQGARYFTQRTANRKLKMWVVHNHPSGDPSPRVTSNRGLQLTRGEIVDSRHDGEQQDDGSRFDVIKYHAKSLGLDVEFLIVDGDRYTHVVGGQLGPYARAGGALPYSATSYRFDPSDQIRSQEYFRPGFEYGNEYAKISTFRDAAKFFRAIVPPTTADSKSTLLIAISPGFGIRAVRSQLDPRSITRQDLLDFKEANGAHSVIISTDLKDAFEQFAGRNEDLVYDVVYASATGTITANIRELQSARSGRKHVFQDETRTRWSHTSPNDLGAVAVEKVFADYDGERNGYKSRNPLDRYSPSNPFFSAALRGVDGIKAKRVARKEVESILKKAPGVTKADIDWLFLDELFGDERLVSLEDLKTHVEAMALDIIPTEVTLGSRGDMYAARGVLADRLVQDHGKVFAVPGLKTYMARPDMESVAIYLNYGASINALGDSGNNPVGDKTTYAQSARDSAVERTRRNLFSKLQRAMGDEVFKKEDVDKYLALMFEVEPTTGLFVEDHVRREASSIRSEMEGRWWHDAAAELSTLAMEGAIEKSMADGRPIVPDEADIGAVVGSDRYVAVGTRGMDDAQIQLIVESRTLTVNQGGHASRDSESARRVLREDLMESLSMLSTTNFSKQYKDVVGADWASENYPGEELDRPAQYGGYAAAHLDQGTYRELMMIAPKVKWTPEQEGKRGAAEQEIAGGEALLDEFDEMLIDAELPSYMTDSEKTYIESNQEGLRGLRDAGEAVSEYNRTSLRNTLLDLLRPTVQTDATMAEGLGIPVEMFGAVRDITGYLYAIKERVRNIQSAEGIKTQYLPGHHHYSEHGIVAHVRFDIRQATSGHSVLFIHEIQSDWLQDVRLQYGRGMMPPHATLAEHVEAYEMNRKVQAGTATDEERVETATKLKHVSMMEYGKAGPESVYNDTWRALALKRMLRYGVDADVDMIAFTPGKLHYALYGTDAVAYRVSDTGSILLYSEDHIRSLKYRASSEYSVGEIERLLEDPGGPFQYAFRDFVSVEDFRVFMIESGAMKRGNIYAKLLTQVEADRPAGLVLPRIDGYIGSYDTMLPQEVKKLTKKLKVQTGRIDLVGHDAIDVHQNPLKKGTLSNVFAVTVSLQMKKRAGDGFTLLGEKFSPAKPMYSNLAKVIEGAKQDKMSADQFRAMLKNAPGVNAEEMRWAFVDEFLKGKKSVTKEEALAWVDANSVNIVTRVLEGDGVDEDELRDRVADYKIDNGDLYVSETEGETRYYVANETGSPLTASEEYESDAEGDLTEIIASEVLTLGPEQIAEELGEAGLLDDFEADEDGSYDSSVNEMHLALVDHIEASGKYSVEEEITDSKWTVREEGGYERGEYDDEEEANDALREAAHEAASEMDLDDLRQYLNEENASETRHDTYAPEGGTGGTYREMLVQLNRRPDPTQPVVPGAVADTQATFKEALAAMAEFIDRIRLKHPNALPLKMNTESVLSRRSLGWLRENDSEGYFEAISTDRWVQRSQNAARSARSLRQSDTVHPYSDHAFTGIEGVEEQIAWLRFDDRKMRRDTTGPRDVEVMYVDETQSDHHQNQRDTGVGPLTDADRARMDELQEMYNTWHHLNTDERAAAGRPLSPEEDFELDVLRRKNSARQEAPFGGAHWANVVTKNAILWAVENRMSHVAIAGSQPHIDRWGSSSFMWRDAGDGKFQLWTGSSDVGTVDEDFVNGRITGALERMKTTHYEKSVVTGTPADLYFAAKERYLSANNPAKAAWKIYQNMLAGKKTWDFGSPRADGQRFFYERQWPKMFKTLGKRFGAKMVTLYDDRYGDVTALEINDKMREGVETVGFSQYAEKFSPARKGESDAQYRDRVYTDMFNDMADTAEAEGRQVIPYTPEGGRRTPPSKSFHPEELTDTDQEDRDNEISYDEADAVSMNAPPAEAEAASPVDSAKEAVFTTGNDTAQGAPETMESPTDTYVGPPQGGSEFVPIGNSLWGALQASPKLDDGSTVTAPDVISAAGEIIRAAGRTPVIREGVASYTPRKAKGSYWLRSKVIDVRRVNDIVTATHEVAHQLETILYGAANPWRAGGRAGISPAQRAELIKLGKDLYGARKPNGGYMREGWAEFLSFYITQDGTSKAPAFTKWFTDTFLPAHPEVAMAVEKARDYARTWRLQGSMARARASIVPSPSRVGRMIDRIKTLGTLEGIGDAFRDMQTAGEDLFFEEGGALRRVTERIKMLIHSDLRPGEDPYRLFNALRGTAGARVRAMLEIGMIDIAGNSTGGPALRDIAGLVGDTKADADDFAIYLFARRAKALWEQPLLKYGREGESAQDTLNRLRNGRPISTENILLSIGGRNPGLSYEDTLYVLDEYVERTNFARAAEMVYQWWDGVADYASQGSSTFKEAFDKIREVDPGSYIPLQREFIELEGISKSSSNAKSGKVSDRLKGSGRRILNPLDSLLARATEVVKSTHERIPLEAFLSLEQRHEGLGEIIREVPVSMVPGGSTSLQEALTQAAKKVGLEEGEMILDLRDTLGDSLEAVIQTFVPSRQAKQEGHAPIIPVMIRGKLRWFQVDADIHDVFAKTNPVRLGGMVDLILGAPKRVFVRGTTGLNPAFAFLTNPSRDVQTLVANSESGNVARVLAMWASAIPDSLAAATQGTSLENSSNPDIDTWAKVMYRSGVPIRAMLSRDADVTRDEALRVAVRGRSVIDRIKGRDAGLLRGLVKDSPEILARGFDIYEKLLGTLEYAPRIAEMKVVAERIGWKPGMQITLDQSVQMLEGAKGVTVDFAAAGKLTRVINQFVPFFNVGFQSIRSYSKLWRRSPKQAILRGVLNFTLPTIAYWLAVKDEEWYKDMEDGPRYAYFYIPVGDEIVRVPRSFEPDFFFGAMVESFLNSAFKVNPEGATAFAERMSQWAGTVGEQADRRFVPGLGGGLVGSLWEHQTNEDTFFGMPIIPRSLQDASPRDQYNEYTTKVGIKIARAISAFTPFEGSPILVDHYIQGVFGTLGREVTYGNFGKAGGLFGRQIDAINDASPEASDTFLIGRLFQRGGQEGTRPRSVDRIYELNREVKQDIFGKRRRGQEIPHETNQRAGFLRDAVRAMSAMSDIKRYLPGTEVKREVMRERREFAGEILRDYQDGKWRRMKSRVRQLEGRADAAERQFKQTVRDQASS